MVTGVLTRRWLGEQSLLLAAREPLGHETATMGSAGYVYGYASMVGKVIVTAVAIEPPIAHARGADVS